MNHLIGCFRVTYIGTVYKLWVSIMIDPFLSCNYNKFE